MPYPNFFTPFDLETGGLSTKGECSPITEIAICAVDSNLEDFQEYTTFVKPYEERSKYQQAALDVSNITLEMCEQNGKDPKVIAKEVVDFFKKCKNASKLPILVGHNIDSFDIPILTYFLNKFGQSLEKVVETSMTIDTKWWGRIAYPDLSGYKQSDCLQREGIDNVQSHRAIHDTRANKEMFVRMMKRLRGQNIEMFGDTSQTRFREKFQFQIASRK